MKPPAISVDFEGLPGEVHLSERKECDPPRDDRYDSEDLVDYYVEKIRLALSWGELDEDDSEHYGIDRLFRIQFDVYHLENEATKRAFHAHLTAVMTVREAKHLRDALDYMISQDD